MTTLPADPGSSTSTDAIGTRYEIRRHVGTGGTADVYLAYDTYLRREVVIKRLKEGNLHEETLRKIWSEAAKMASLRHANIVSIFDVVELDHSPSIIMEHLSGESIEERAGKKPLEEGDFLDIARQSLEGLVAAHHAGIIHRDLKPSNIMLVPQPSGRFQVKLLDFGMAKFVTPDAPSPQTVSIDGSITGSIYCISPEQLNHEPVDARSDLYSLGCTFYYALTGKYPFTGDRVADVITAHLTHAIVPVEKIRPELHTFLSRWVMSLLERQPGARYSSAMDALRALEAGMAGTLSGATGRLAVPLPGTARPGNGRPLVAGLIVLGLLALAGIGYFAFRKPEPVMPPTPPPVATTVREAPTPAPVVVQAPSPTPAPTPLPSPTPTPVAAAAAVVPETVLRMSGSNTIGSKVGPGLIDAFLRQKGWGNVTVADTGRENERRVAGVPPGDNAQPLAGIVAAHGSGTSFKDLAAGKCDIGMSSRPVKPEEAAALKDVGDMTSVACEHVIGLDGLAIIVHRSNPVAALSVADVAAIFSGRITDWSAVGGPAGPIHLYGRNDLSGTFDSFQAMVLGKEPLSPQTKRFEDSAALSDEVSRDPAGIGFIGLPYVRHGKALAISEAGSAPLLPSPFTVATEDYPLSRRLYLYTPANPSNPLTNEFIEFALSAEGQDVVRQSGFVSQVLTPENAPLPETAPAAYQKTVEGAARLNTTLRFLSGSTSLDGKARRDIDRIMALMSRPENAGKRLLVLGFSDTSGTPQANRSLSIERARTVASELTLRGLEPVVIEGFGDILPVATNASESGRAKNRRVEVWML